MFVGRETGEGGGMVDMEQKLVEEEEEEAGRIVRLTVGAGCVMAS